MYSIPIEEDNDNMGQLAELNQTVNSFTLGVSKLVTEGFDGKTKTCILITQRLTLAEYLFIQDT